MLTNALGERVPPQSVHRWTLPKGDRDYSVPNRRRVEAIERLTGGEVTPASWYADGLKTPRRARSTAASQQASRRAAATRRRLAQAREARA